MRGFTRLRGGALPLAIGLGIGLVVAPVSAVAAVRATQVILSDGHDRAGITGAGQVQVATTDVRAAKFRYTPNISSATCTKIITAPPTSGLVVTQIRFAVWSNPTTGGSNFFGVSTSPTCPVGADLLLRDNPSRVGVDTFTFDPGVPLKPRRSLYAFALGAPVADAMVSAYTVPKKAVPAVSPVTAARTGTGGR